VKEVLREIRTRIFGMALVHEQLYESGDLGEIDMEAYFRLLVAEIMSIYSSEAGEVEAVVEAKDMLLPVDEAIPLGLIVGELVTNSLQHAFRGREGGRISLSFRDEGDLRLLVLGDDGIGRPSEGGNPKGLGGDLVDALCRQLGGSFRYLSGKGCVAELRFPASPASGQGGAWLRPKA
jgi:two-component sensor histidine kinase